MSKITVEIDEKLPEGFEIARFAKPLTSEAQLAPGERRLVVDVILRPKRPRQWLMEEDGMGRSEIWSDDGSVKTNASIVREVTADGPVVGEELCPRCGSNDPNIRRVDLAVDESCNDLFHGMKLDSLKRKVVKFTFLRRAVPGIGDWVTVGESFQRATINDVWHGEVNIYRRDEEES